MACEIWNKNLGNFRVYIISYFKGISNIHIDGIEQTKKQDSFANKNLCTNPPHLEAIGCIF